MALAFWETVFFAVKWVGILVAVIALSIGVIRRRKLHPANTRTVAMIMAPFCILSVVAALVDFDLMIPALLIMIAAVLIRLKKIPLIGSPRSVPT